MITKLARTSISRKCVSMHILFFFFMKNQVNALILKGSYVLGIVGVILNAGYTNKVLKKPALSVLFKGNLLIRSKILGINNKNCTK